MKKKIWAAAALVLALALGLGIWGFLVNHTMVDGQLVHNSAQSFTWQGSSLENMDRLYNLTGLRQLNLEKADVTPEQYEALQQALPGCQIVWQVPFQGKRYSQNTETLTVETLHEEDLAVLQYFPQLSFVDAATCRDYEALAALQKQYPGCAVSYTVDLAGKTYPADTTELNTVTGDLAALDQALALLPKLQSVRVQGCDDALAVKALAEKYPQCAFVYDISIGGQTVPSDTPSLTLTAEDYADLTRLLPCFTSLADVTVTGSTQALDMHALADAYPATRFHYDFEAFGHTVHTDQEFWDLSGVNMADTQALEAVLPYFHSLKQVDMVGCGLENEVMGSLNDRHPDTLFVWTVKIGQKYYRTDITYFYPSGSKISMVHVDLTNLKYCTQLVALDLGHFLVADCSFVEYMPDLEYLILAIGPLEDVRPIGTLKKLKYLEIFSTDVTDYWPLLNCTSLEDLNLAFSGHGDITPLLQMPWLNRLWLSCNKEVFSEEEKAILAEHLPNTIMVFSSGSATNKGWRNSPNYYAMRDFLGTGYMVA